MFVSLSLFVFLPSLLVVPPPETPSSNERCIPVFNPLFVPMLLLRFYIPSIRLVMAELTAWLTDCFRSTTMILVFRCMRMTIWITLCVACLSLLFVAVLSGSYLFFFSVDVNCSSIGFVQYTTYRVGHEHWTWIEVGEKVSHLYADIVFQERIVWLNELMALSGYIIQVEGLRSWTIRFSRQIRQYRWWACMSTIYQFEFDKKGFHAATTRHEHASIVH